MSSSEERPAAEEKDAVGLLSELSARGIDLRADGSRLVCNAPKGAITPELGEAIRAHKQELLAQLAARAEGERPIPSVARDGALPLGFVQQRMWVHDVMQPETVLYSLPAAWRLLGPLDRRAFDEAMRTVVSRHEVMRCRLEIDGAEPRQRFDAPIPDGIPFEDRSDLPVAEREAWLKDRLEAARDQPFDFAAGPLWHALLLRFGPEEHVFFFLPHHVIWDGWSFDVFLRELAESYTARIEDREPRLPELPIQYADYAVWHRDWLHSGEIERQQKFWERRLAGEPSALEVSTDHPRPPVFTHRGSWEEFEIEAPVVEALASLGRQHGATPFMVMLAAWQAFLHRLSGQEDIVVGVPIQARQRPEVADLIGCFVNTLALRAQVSGDRPFDAFLDEVARQSVEGYEHQDTPFELLIDALVKQWTPSRTPIFQAMLSHQQTSRRPQTLGPLRLGQVHVNPAATPTDLMLAVMEGAAGARGVLHYSTDIFDAESVAAMRRRFETFLGGILEQPSSPICDLPFLTAEEYDTVVTTWNRTAADYPRSARLGDAFVERARETPDAVAIEGGSGELTYGELDRASSRLAHQLGSLGVGPGSIVGVLLERSPRLVEGLLGVLKAGAAYLPLDPQYPHERLRFMVEHSGAGVLVSEGDLAEDLSLPDIRVVSLDSDAESLEGQPSTPVESRANPDDLAYVIYTSGSTGRPKGVQIPHRAAVNFVNSMRREPGLGSSDRLLAITTTSFDISVLELFGPLSVGATVLLADRDEAMDGHALTERLSTARATVMQATPASWRLLIESGWTGSPQLKALCGGEALPAGLARELIPRVGELWNMYGPTETTVWSTCSRVTDADRITIGRPIDNTRVYVVDARRRPVPPGVAGELFIGGDGVARGYLGQDELTAERFVPDTISGDGTLMYRTGDLGRWLPSGELEHLGRADHQVKVRGFRIELGEIESLLTASEGVQSAAVVLRDFSSDVRLVAYVVVDEHGGPRASDLRKRLREQLPDYMVPSSFVFLPTLPLTPSGKVDRRALPAPEAVHDEVTAGEPPHAGTEQQVAAAWRDILGLEQVGRSDNFFDLGGHSLLAIRVAHRLEVETGVRLSPRELLFRTLKQVAAAYDTEVGPVPEATSAAPPDRWRDRLGRLLGLR